MGKFYTDQERYECCRKWKISGLSINQYAKEIGMSRGTLRDWVCAYKNLTGKFINISNLSERENTIIEDKDVRLNILSDVEKIQKSTHFSRFDHSIVTIEYKDVKITTSLEQAERLLERIYGQIQ